MRSIVLAVILAACSSTSTTSPTSGSGAGAGTSRPRTSALAHSAAAPAADSPTKCVAKSAGAQCTDLLTPPVAAGAEVTTGVTLPKGGELVGAVRPSDGFVVESSTVEQHDDGAWLSVKARNAGSADARFSATLDYSAP